MKADSAPTERDRLLKEGGLSYSKAMLALSLFREMVQEACVEAMQRSLPGLSGAPELQLKPLKVKPYAAPDKPGSGGIDGTRANLGAKLEKPEGAGWSLWNYIRWRDDPWPLSVTVSIDFTDAGIAGHAWAEVGDHGMWEYDEETKEIHLSRGIEAADLVRLKSILDEMNREWIKGWQDVRGVKQFLRKR